MCIDKIIEVEKNMFKHFRADLRAVKRNDPAARHKLEIFFTYSGPRALRWHRFARFFYRIKFKFLASKISQIARFLTGIEIHPAAKIGLGVFIDHGMGVVIGETAEIGDNVVIYQGVTLGGTGKEKGKRHPTIRNNVKIYAGAKVLGNIVVGENSIVGAQAVVLKDVPPNCTVVGVPARIVKSSDPKDFEVYNKNKELDPIMDEINALKIKINELTEELNRLKPQNDK